MASTTFVTIDGVNFTKRQHDVLVAKALRVADAHEYCDEAEKMLAAVGLTVPSREVEVTLKVTVRLERGVDPSTIENQDFLIEDNLGRIEDIFKVVVVK